MSIVMAAGGTGGHIIPALVVADNLIENKSDLRIVFIGAGTPVENKLLSNKNYNHEVISSPPFVGQSFINKTLSIMKYFMLLFKTIKILRKHRARVVVGFGGYPSVLPVIAARILGLKIIIFEQNGVVGKANSFLSLFANKFYASPSCPNSKKITSKITSPVRNDIRKVKPWSMPFKESSFNILIVGGSQGAVKINSAVCSILDSLKKYNISIVHQTGEKDFLRVSEHYSRFKINSKVIPFIENISESYEFAHLIICRAGAGTVSEILTIERPTIFIPLAISNAHQFYNIKDLEAANACNYLVQDENLEKNLLSLVVKYIESPEYLKEMLYNLSEYKSRNDIQDGTLALTNSILELLSLH